LRMVTGPKSARRSLIKSLKPSVTAIAAAQTMIISAGPID
jgi:hypothetical protein